MSGKYFEATDQNFKTEILESDKVALVDFWAAWCGPCMMLGPVIEELATDYEGKAIIAKVNVTITPILQHSSVSAAFLQCLCSRTERLSTRWLVPCRRT